MVKSFFLDTYAIFEIISGNPGYAFLKKGEGIMTSSLNLMELYHGLLSKVNVSEAERYYDAFLDYTVPFDTFIIKESMKFRFAQRKRKLSYADCVGYIIAKTRGAAFVTGDREFEGMDGVRYIK